MQHEAYLGRLAAAMPPMDPPAAARALRERLLAERDRWLLWLPVCLGLGVAAFFALPGEPGRWAGLAAALAGCAAAAGALAAGRARAALRRALCVGLAAAAAGFALAQARLEAVGAPVLAREGSFEVTGRVAALEPRGRGVRLLLEEVALAGRRTLPPDATPRRVRVTLARGGEALAPGQRVRLRARLQPPAPPAVPGGFDYARQAYFEGLGALGYGMGAAVILEETAPGAGGVAELRARIARRITEVLPGATGAFAAALIAGVRAAIDDATWRAFQVSGLAHLISISGLHMTLVAGTVFGAARYGLALIPWLALRVRVHKPAAVLAFAAVAGYALLAGNTVPTQRSFLMIAVALGAVLLDRNPFSLRVLAWAAVVVLALRPEALVGASFQLSFAAVLALMAAFEALRLRRERAGTEGEPGLAGRCGRYAAGVAATTVIAGCATAPFAAYHFQNVATYGVLANLVAVPITTFLVMPAGLLGLALMPFGLDAPALRLMGVGVDAVLATADLAAGLPGAAVAVARWPGAVLALAAVGGLWLALWRRRWRLLGLAPCGAALLWALLAPAPALLVDPALGAALRRLPDGRLVLLEWERDGRRRGDWLRALGAGEFVRGPIAGGALPGDDGVACDASGCVVRLGDASVSLARDAGAAAEDCALVDLVVSRAGPETCRGGAARLVGPRALRASGGLALRAGGRGGIAVETVAGARGTWPWSRPNRS